MVDAVKEKGKIESDIEEDIEDYEEDDYLYDDDYWYPHDDYYDEEDCFDWEQYDYSAAEHQTEILTKYYAGEELISELIQQTHVEPNYFCLATRFILIADIDCGDKIDVPLQILENHVETFGGSFRVYKTKNGMRYLQTDVLYHGCNKQAVSVLRTLGSDEKYIRWCVAGNQFMARIAPKLENSSDYYQKRIDGVNLNIAICHFMKTVGNDKIASMLEQSIQVHDYMTQAFYTELPLA